MLQIYTVSLLFYKLYIKLSRLFFMLKYTSFTIGLRSSVSTQFMSMAVEPTEIPYLRLHAAHRKVMQQEVWPPGSADTVCPRRLLMTQVQHWAKTAKTGRVTLRP